MDLQLLFCLPEQGGWAETMQISLKHDFVRLMGRQMVAGASDANCEHWKNQELTSQARLF